MKTQFKFDKRFSFLIFLTISICLMTACDKEEKEKEKIIETGTVTDIDGNVYKTVKIGNQWWMAENLAVTRYNDSTDIRKAQQPTEWVDTISAYCVYDITYDCPGLLYNWYAVTDVRKIAPKGWHIPTDEEWKELETSIGMSQDQANKTSWRGTDEANKLRTSGYSSWKEYEGIWSTNEIGFSALAGSCRIYNGTAGNPGITNTGFWWTASVNQTGKPWYRYMDYKKSTVFRYYEEKSYGFSIRCVKD